MEEKFQINEKTKIIAKSGKKYIVSNDENANIDNIFAKGVIVDKNYNIMSPVLPIGVLTKGGYWYLPDQIKNELDVSITVKASLFGFAVGDAFGVPVEFLNREKIRQLNLENMIGNGTHRVPEGAWSDDTSMLIATMDAINKCDGKINFNKIMDNFIEWLKNAKYSSIDKTFGVGNIIYNSLKRYMNGTPALDCGGKEYMDNGNGSLMRILPISLYCIFNEFSEGETVSLINEASSITHAHEISKMSCYIYTEFLRSIVKGENILNSFDNIININYEKYYSKETIEKFNKLLNKAFKDISDSEIKESGYVIDTLESVFYSLLNTENYEDAIKMAVNLGYDTDTVAGITGSIAGVYYGIENIPKRWIQKLQKFNYLLSISKDFSKTLLKESDVKIN